MNVHALETAVAPLDAARRLALRAATRSALLTRVLARRESRIALLASMQVTALFALSLRAPVALFYLGPAIFGASHLAADVRYLFVRHRASRSLVAASVAFAVAITVTQLAAATHHLPVRVAERADVSLGVAWAAFALVVGWAPARGSRVARAGTLVAALAVGSLLVAHARTVELLLLHAHNVVALALWLALFRRRAGWSLVPLALVVAFAAVLLSGAYVPWTYFHGGFSAFGTRAESLAAALAPGAGTNLGVAVLGTFVFLQGVHYAVWTAWIPQDALPGEGTPTFRMSVRALARDFGPLVFLAIVLAALGLGALALWNIRAALGWYVPLAKFHAWLECAFCAYAVAGGTRAPVTAR